MSAAIDRASAAIRRGLLVVYPTDTLYALGAAAGDRRAVERLYSVKRRPTSLPVSLALSSLEEVESLAGLSRASRAYLRRYLPGPLTVLVKPAAEAGRTLSPLLRGPRGEFALRVPDHPVARELARRTGPVVCTSANRHGRPPAGTLAGVHAELGREVAVYLDGAPRPRGTPSTIVDLTGERPVEVAR